LGPAAAETLRDSLPTWSPKQSTRPKPPARTLSTYCGGKVIAAVVKAGAKFSFAIAGSPAVDTAIAAIPDEGYTPVHHPGAVTDPDTGELISDAQV
jgi:hypothetical protein